MDIEDWFTLGRGNKRLINYSFVEKCRHLCLVYQRYAWSRTEGHGTSLTCQSTALAVVAKEMKLYPQMPTSDQVGGG